MIKAVLFDYGGVLSPGGKNVKLTYSKVLDIPADQLDINEISSEYRRGEILDEDFFVKLSKHYGTTVTPEQFLAASDIFVRYDKVYELADKLRAAGIKTGILSNMYKMSAKVLRDQGFYDGFEPILLSCDEGMAKPQPEFYQLALQRLGCLPEEVIFIDDQEKCLPVAEQLGMYVIKADDEGQIVADIKAILKKENKLEL